MEHERSGPWRMKSLMYEVEKKSSRELGSGMYVTEEACLTEASSVLEAKIKCERMIRRAAVR